MSSSANERRRRSARYWLLVVAGGVGVVAVTAGAIVGVALLLGRSPQGATSSLGVAVIGLGPDIGTLVQRRRKRSDRK